MRSRLRTATRALAALALVPAALLAAPTASSRSEALALSTLRELIAVDSAEPAGSRACVDAIAARLRSAGFDAEDLRILAPAEHPEKANLVVRLPGRGMGRPLLWTAHLDVVAADPADWSVPPFALTEREGWYYGRGTGDMKGEVAALVAGLIRLKGERFMPRHDLVVAFTADEEAAGHVNGIRWLLATQPELLDAELAINPDAGTSAMRDGMPLLFGIETAEKTYATFTLAATGAGGHSSQPGPDNAIYQLSAALVRLAQHRFPVRITRAAREFLAVDADLEAADASADIRAVLATPPDAAAAERLIARPALAAQIRTTCVATVLSAGSAENALPQRAQATVNCRLLPGDDVDSVRHVLEEVVGDPKVTVVLAHPVNASPETVPAERVIAAIGGTVHSLWPRIPVFLSMQAGGSDAIFTRAAGMPTYGVTSIFADMEDNRHHARDERISMSAFRQGVEFTYRLMRALDTALDEGPER
jgi:acetylornithine deacetylase/succinyl-diaminopimelate desuccinylase-like protein